MTALGATTVMKEYFEHGTTDFYTLLTKLQPSGADGVFVAAETQDGSTLVKQKAELGPRDQGVRCRLLGHRRLHQADRRSVRRHLCRGALCSTMTTPKNQAFVKAYTARYKRAPGKYSAAGYNAMNILVDAIARAGSTDPDKLRDALDKTDYEGPNGHFQFDARARQPASRLSWCNSLNGVPDRGGQHDHRALTMLCGGGA